IWRAGTRARQEHADGPRDGEYGVRSGKLWWSWNPRTGATSNQDDPRVGSAIGEELSVMLDPTPLLGALKFAALGRSTVAARPTITAEATPRPADPRRGPPCFELRQLGSAADHFALEVDLERGLLLEALA